MERNRKKRTRHGAHDVLCRILFCAKAKIVNFNPLKCGDDISGMLSEVNVKGLFRSKNPNIKYVKVTFKEKNFNYKKAVKKR